MTGFQYSDNFIVQGSIELSKIFPAQKKDVPNISATDLIRQFHQTLQNKLGPFAQNKTNQLM